MFGCFSREMTTQMSHFSLSQCSTAPFQLYSAFSFHQHHSKKAENGPAFMIQLHVALFLCRIHEISSSAVTFIFQGAAVCIHITIVSLMSLVSTMCAAFDPWLWKRMDITSECGGQQKLNEGKFWKTVIKTFFFNCFSLTRKGPSLYSQNYTTKLQVKMEGPSELLRLLAPTNNGTTCLFILTVGGNPRNMQTSYRKVPISLIYIGLFIIVLRCRSG